MFNRGNVVDLRFLLVPLIGVVLSFAVFAGTTGKIAGKVTNAATGEPLAGVDVFIENTTLGSATDAEGDYFIINVPPGEYTVTASYVGYTTLSKTNVMVHVDRTITVNFQLETATVEGQEVTVVAERDVVRLDVSASQYTAEQGQIAEVPLVIDVQEFIDLQAGVEDGIIRGGGLDQTALVVDGLTAVDNVSNRPLNLINLSAVEEVNIIKGGFNAEYGNIRSGLINIVTKEGSSQRYSASLDVRYGVPYQKHRGANLFDPNNFYLRPYLDPAVAFVGTANGGWDEETQKQYFEFRGWNAVSEELLSDDDPGNDATPEELRNLFIWQTRAKGSAELGHPRPGEYGNDPDLNVDISLGGPLPFVSRPLGNATFFISHRDNTEQFVIPAAVDNFHERNTFAKINTKISNNIKFGVEAAIGKIETITGGGQGNPVNSENFFVDFVTPPGQVSFDRGIFFPHGEVPMDVTSSVIGLTYDHVFNKSTFLNVRASLVNVKNDATGPETFRDLTPLRSFGAFVVDEQPWGFSPPTGYIYANSSRYVIGGVGGAAYDTTKATTFNLRVDFTSQVDKYNQLKAGFELVRDNLDAGFGERSPSDPTGDFVVEYHEEPIRFGAYLQDKLEFKGMIANLGLRLDINDPNTPWFTRNDRFSPFFSRQFKNRLLADAPQEEAKGNVRLSPRLGISHPITRTSKLYFNYGHFYSLPISQDLYQINFGSAASAVQFVGNPNLDLPKTIAYELGYEHELSSQFLFSVAGYYKDVSNQTGEVNYVNFDNSVNYTTVENINYADIRGLELSLERRWGSWITGWVNYTFEVITEGFTGREFFYEDPRRQQREGRRNPKQEKPIAQPFARASILLRSPEGWGPEINGAHLFDNVGVNLLFQYRAGEHFTWEPVQPRTVENNVQWRDFYNFNARISKDFDIGRYNVSFFADIKNIFDIEQLNGAGFFDVNDFRDYMNSLHLPIYSEAKYQGQGLQAGDDRPGDVRSADKPYINMPNIDFAAWNPPRSVVFGFRFNF